MVYLQLKDFKYEPQLVPNYYDLDGCFCLSTIQVENGPESLEEGIVSITLGS